MTQPGVTSNSHLDRKALKKPDAVTVTLRTFVERLFGNTKVVSIMGVITIVALVTTSVYMSKRQKAEREASLALFHAEKSLQTEMESLTKPLIPAPPTDKTQKAKPADPKALDPVAAFQFKTLDVDATFKDSVPLYKKIFETHPKQAAGHRARMTLAKLYWDHAEKEKALSLYQASVVHAPSPLDKANALLALGFAQEDLGKNPDAIATFQQLALLPETSIKDVVLLALARNYEVTKDFEKAKATYGQIQKDYLETDSAKIATSRLSVLK